MQPKIIAKFNKKSNRGEYSWEADITKRDYDDYTSYSVHATSEMPNRLYSYYELYFSEEEAQEAFKKHVDRFLEISSLIDNGPHFLASQK